MDDPFKQAEYAALVAACAAAPADDLPRVVLADWLEERSGKVTCHSCAGRGERSQKTYHGSYDAWRCLACGGSGRTGDAAWHRATFIRLQLAAAHATPCDRYADMKPCNCPRCEECKWKAVHGRPATGLSLDLHQVWRRGFVDEVCGALRRLVGWPCNRCNAHGYYDRADGDGEMACLDCGGRGREPGELARLGPDLLVVTRADPTDCGEPSHGDDGPQVPWYWPEPLCAALGYDAAVGELFPSRAVLAVACRAAGLTPAGGGD